MYLGFWRPVALKPAPLLGVGRKCALELSNSGEKAAETADSFEFGAYARSGTLSGSDMFTVEGAGPYITPAARLGGAVGRLGLETDTNASVRSEAFHRVIDQYSDMKMVAQQSAEWDQTEAYEKTEAILQSNPDITGIICGNDTMACGAAAACADAGRSDMKIIGVDGSDDAAALIKAGQMVGTALQQCALISEMAVQQADDYLKNGATGLDEKQLVDCVAITSANVDKLSAFVYTE